MVATQRSPSTACRLPPIFPSPTTTYLIARPSSEVRPLLEPCDPLLHLGGRHPAGALGLASQRGPPRPEAGRGAERAPRGAGGGGAPATSTRGGRRPRPPDPPGRPPRCPP